MSANTASHLTSLLKHAKEVVDKSLPEGTSGTAFDGAVVEDRLNPVLFAVLSAGRSNAAAELSEEDRIDLWHIVCKLWVRIKVVLLQGHRVNQDSPGGCWHASIFSPRPT